MKKRTKIALIVLAVLLVAMAGVCWWQRNNLTALKMSLDYSQEDLAERIEENDQRVGAALEELPDVTVRDLTDEEKAAFRNDTLDRDKLIERLIGKAQPEQADASEQAEGAAASQPSDEGPEAAAREQLARCIAEIYVMKAEYSAWLEAQNAAAIEEFNALPEKEQTTAAKYKIGMAHMKTALEKETECDQKMAALEDEISALLKELGEDTSLVDEIQAAYEEEKTLKKAYLLSLH